MRLGDLPLDKNDCTRDPDTPDENAHYLIIAEPAL